MKWTKKYKVNIQKVHELNMAGYSIPEIGKMVGVPRTTLSRYLAHSGFTIQLNRSRINLKTWKKTLDAKKEFVCSDSWKSALIRAYGHKCAICGYTHIV